MKKYYQYLWKEIVMRLCFHILYMCAIAALPYIIKNMVDCKFVNGIYDVIKWIIIFAAFVLMGMGAQYVTQRSAWKLDKKFYERIRQEYFLAIIKKKPEEFGKKKIGEYLSQINNDIAGCEEYIEYVMEVCESVIGLIVYAIYIFLLDMRIACIIYLAAFITLFLPRVTGTKLSNKKQFLLSETGKYTNTVMDLLKGFSFINRYTEKAIFDEHGKSLHLMENARYAYGKYKTFANVLNGSVMYIVNTAAFGIIAILLCEGSITAGVATATISYIQDFMFPLRTIIDSISAVKAVEGIKNRIVEEIENTRYISISKAVFRDEVRIDKVSLAFADFELNEISYTFVKGKTYAITGNSGTGKSTILKIITQRIMQKTGDVWIDNLEANYDLCNDLIFYSEQGSHVYAAPYQDNVTMFGSYKYEKNIEKLTGSDRYNSIYDSKNCNELSGGEKQIVLLARALLSDKEILVLDEPFSAMNKDLEVNLTKELLGSGKTIILVTHNIEKEYLDMFDYVISL